MAALPLITLKELGYSLSLPEFNFNYIYLGLLIGLVWGILDLILFYINKEK